MRFIPSPTRATPDPLADNLVFVHGLGGSGSVTWTAPRTGFCLPDALADAFAHVNVFVADYPSGKWVRTPFAGAGASVSDLASMVAEQLRAVRGPGRIFFVTHRLGGLLVKQILRVASTSDDSFIKS